MSEQRATPAQQGAPSGTPAAPNPAQNATPEQQNATPAPPAPPAATPPPAPREPRPPIQGTRSYTGAMVIMPRTFDEVQRIAQLFAKAGDMVPETFRENVQGCAMAIMWGMELGVSPIQAIQGIAVIRGRPSVWGDLLIALVMRHPDFDDILEEEIRDGTTVVGARCTVWRRGRTRPRVQEFTMADALKAGLLPAKADAAWTKYTNRMLKMRARSWCLRDEFPDALRGMAVVEEMMQSGHTIEGEFHEVRPAAAQADIPQPREVAPTPAPAAIEQQKNPLNENLRDQIRKATPDLAALHDAPAPTPAAAAVSFADLDDLGPLPSTPAPAQQLRTEGQTDDLGAGDFFSTTTQAPEPAPAPAPAAKQAAPKEPESVLPRFVPLSKGGRQLLDVYLDAAAPFGITEQTLIDQLGDNVHGGNLQEAQDILQRWIERKGTT
jgi:hypothetical protein